MAVRDLIKEWDDALALALSARQPELGDSDLEAVYGPDSVALEVRSGLVAGKAWTKGPTCGCTWDCYD